MLPCVASALLHHFEAHSHFITVLTESQLNPILSAQIRMHLFNVILGAAVDRCLAIKIYGGKYKRRLNESVAEITRNCTKKQQILEKPAALIKTLLLINISVL